MPTTTDGSAVAAPGSPAVGGTTYMPTRPASDTFLNVYTFQDAVLHVLDAFSQQFTEGYQKRSAMRAVMQAYQEFPNYDDWTYYRKRLQITTTASQTTGTIAFDFTGGAQERMVTLSGATWPASAIWYRVLINAVSYRIESRVSNTVITLAVDSNPGADVSAGTAYTLYRSSYPLPADFRRGTRLQSAGYYGWPSYVEPPDLLARERYYYTPSDPPLYYTMKGAEQIYSGLVIEFTPPPSAARTYDSYYTAQPRPIRPFVRSPEYVVGQVAGVSGTTVTFEADEDGVVPALSSRMVGCILRLGIDDTIGPSGYVGIRDDSVVYSEQRVIIDVVDGVTATIDAAVTGTESDYADTLYTICDPIDMDTTVMWNAFLYLCEANYSRMAGHPRNEVDERMALAYGKIKEAKGADYRNGKIQETESFPRLMPILFETEA